VIGLVQVGWQARADRYMYLPIVGILWIVVDLGGRAFRCLRPSLRLLLPICAVACLVAAGIAAHYQVGLWRNTFGIAGQSIAAVGTSPKLIALLGTAHLRAGRWQAALPLLDRALKEEPKDASIAINLAIAQFLGGNRSEAINLAQQILAQDPDYFPAHLNLARFYRDMGQLDLARQHSERMRQLNPAYPPFELMEDSPQKSN
jgi:protein O-mannosyl-transferase